MADNVNELLTYFRGMKGETRNNQAKAFNDILAFMRNCDTERDKWYRLAVQLNMYGISDVDDRKNICQFIGMCENIYGHKFLFENLSEEHKKNVVDFPYLLCPNIDAPITDFLYF